jgi:predicted homoserine dehydrogenase-like protein
LPSLLFLKPTDLDTNQKRSNYRVAVVGCGHKGIFLANSFADAGFNVICTDADAAVVKRVAKGKTAFAMPEAEAKLKGHIASEKIDVTSELKKAVAQSDIVVIAITTKIDDQKKNDYAALVNTCKQVGAALKQGTLVLYGGIAGLGFTEGTIKEKLENTSGFKTGKDFGLAYSPILDTKQPIGKSELRVAASDQVSLNAAVTLLKALTDNICQVNDLKTAEIAALFAVAKHDLVPGDTLDAIGGTTYYSLIDTYEAAKAECLLPIGLAKGAKIIRPVKMDTPITCADVEIKPSAVYSLRQLQEQWFEGKLSEAELLKAVDALAID